MGLPIRVGINAEVGVAVPRVSRHLLSDPLRNCDLLIFLAEFHFRHDESFVLAAHTPGVPVLVGRDRRVVGHHAVSVFDAQIVVLDDGFQHHRLARDLDIVCIDGPGGFGNRCWDLITQTLSRAATTWPGDTEP